MESWSYVSGGKGFVSDESVSYDAIEAKNGSLNWELKNPFSFGINLVSPDEQCIDNNNNQGFGVPEMMRKSVSSSSKIGCGIMFNSITPAQNAFSEGETDESSLKLSSSVAESNSRDSGFIDLKLGGFGGGGGGGGDRRETFANPNPNLGSAESSHTQTHTAPAKRMRVGGFGSQTPLCQVHGCKKNLSSCKDYHKRHKVCEVHSKTSKVIVNGLEQRFCQQCSRFHLLPEFDDGKRSCRKRLAGHNQRRRKPHVGVNGRPVRLFPSYDYSAEGTAGSGSKGNTNAPPSYNSQDITPSSMAYLQKYGENDWSGHIKLEEETSHDHQSTISFQDGKMHSRSLYPFGFQKYYSPLHEVGPNPSPHSKYNGDSTQYSHNTGLSNFNSRSFFQSNTIGGQDFTMFDSGSTVQELSGIPPDTGCALSLLSSQSQSSSSLPSQFHMAHPLLIPGRQNTDYGGTQLSVNHFGMDPQASETGVSNNCHSSAISSVEETHLDSILISDGSNAAATYGINGFFQGSEYGNSRERLCSEDGPTIDLLQLSSQLHRVEHHRQGLRVKPEDDTFFGLRIS